MDIEEFVKSVLGQLARSVNGNTSGEATYTIDRTKGVDFDLAVVTTNTESSQKGISGGLSIKVVGADASKSSTNNSSQEVTSRIKFNVDID